jgi:lactoylglutathione lyase
MSSARPRRPWAMSDIEQGTTTVTNIGVAMFAVSDVDAAIAFYTEKLGFELRADVTFGPEDQQGRWVEVAPRGSTARLALNPPMEGSAGGGAIGVETPDVQAEYERLKDVEGVTIDYPPMDVPGAPKLFMLRDPDGNHIAVVEVPAA